MLLYYRKFDDLLVQMENSNPIENFEQVQRVLKEKIVNPLRSYHFVRADKTMELRQLLHDIPADKNIMHEEQGNKEFYHQNQS